MCIACKTYGRNKITNEQQLKKALQSLKGLFYNADEEMLLHLDALTNRWLSGKSGDQFIQDSEVDKIWGKAHC